MVVIVNYLTNKAIPTEVIAAAAPVVCFSLTYFVASIKYYMRLRQEKIEVEDYEHEVMEILKDNTIPEDKKEQLRSEMEEIRFLRIREKRERILARHEDIMSQISASSPQI